jgi:ribose/xylose/arabinose/galactoside ABC-type transport system permease subunit
MFGANPLAARYAAVDIERLLLKVYVASECWPPSRAS